MARALILLLAVGAALAQPDAPAQAAADLAAERRQAA
jgi:hypothetical protein